MVDAVQIFPPGFRVVDVSGFPVSGAKVKFFEVGPGAARNVFSDKDLTSSLGPIVYTRSDGYPVANQGSNTVVEVYTGNTPYYVLITDASDVAIWPAQNNVLGALNTTNFLQVGAASTLQIKGASKTGTYTLVAADNGKAFNLDPTGGNFAVTCTAAATLGDGWWCILRNHAANDNVVQLIASQDIATPTAPSGTRSFPIRRGAAYILTCNGGAFAISGAPPYLNGPVGIITIADRVAAAPGAPTIGARYICTAIFSITNSAGNVVSTAVGDIIEADGAGRWIQLTPFTNCGWLAWVQTETAYYYFQASAWQAQIATRTDVQTASNVLLPVTPGRQHFHPGHPKAWAQFSKAGAVTVNQSYGINSIVSLGTGTFTVNFTNNFANTNYVATGLVNQAGGTFSAVVTNFSGRAVGSMGFGTARTDTGALGDGTDINLAFFGTLA
jgi:hypothetical protein